MAMYEYKCPSCEVTKETVSAHPIACRDCGVDMQRVYSFVTTNMPTGAGTKMPRKPDR